MRCFHDLTYQLYILRYWIYGIRKICFLIVCCSHCDILSKYGIAGVVIHAHDSDRRKSMRCFRVTIQLNITKHVLG